MAMRDRKESSTEKAGDQLKVHKGLVSGTSRGQGAETLFITYQALIKSTLDYAASSLYVKPSPLERLQMLQNARERLILISIM